MNPPDDSALLHADRPYDPKRAHEYYLRTRKLKGRKKGIGADTGRVPQVTNITYLTGPAKMQVGNKKQNHRQKVEAEVAALQKRLDRLHDVLAELVKLAKERSGVETKPAQATKKAEPAKDTPDKPKTTREKKIAAKKAKDAYAKTHPQAKQSPSQQATALKAEVKQVRDRILKIREQLRASVDQAQKRAAASPKPVTALQGRRH